MLISNIYFIFSLAKAFVSNDNKAHLKAGEQITDGKWISSTIMFFFVSFKNDNRKEDNSNNKPDFDNRVPES